MQAEQGLHAHLLGLVTGAVWACSGCATLSACKQERMHTQISLQGQPTHLCTRLRFRPMSPVALQANSGHCSVTPLDEGDC